MKKKIVIGLLSLLILCVFSAVQAREVIYYGSKDREGVYTVQDKLKRWGYYNGKVDGGFGYLTEEAVKYFQRKNNLKVTGMVDDETFRALGMSTGENPNYSNDSEVNLLARCINGEARGEPYEGQVAVAAVILNRVEHSDFPNSISGVVYQKGAFDAVADGQVNLQPNESCIRAARDALAGWDPTSGAIYYYNPKTATNKWIRSREIIARIGRHVFCR